MDAKETSITPFRPRPFPPRDLRMKTILPTLKKTHAALQEHAEAFAQLTHPNQMLDWLQLFEARASLDSQAVQVPLLTLLQPGHPPAEKKEHIQAIKRYVQALQFSCRESEKAPLSDAFICTLHRKIKSESASRKDLGKYRNRQNWIGPYGCSIEEGYFYPPKVKQIRPMMKKLWAYCRRKKDDPLIATALFFAQFLIIHPFMDGNGRIARTISALLLYQKGALPTPTLYLSAYFNKHRLRYFQRLFDTTEENHFEPWILFFLKGVIQEARKGTKLFKHCHTIEQKLLQELGCTPKLQHFLFKSPVFTTSAFLRAGGSKEELNTLKRWKWIRKKGRAWQFVLLLNHY